MDRLTNRLLVLALPIVGCTLLGRGIASYTSGHKAGTPAVVAQSAAPVASFSPPNRTSSEPTVAPSKGRESVRRLPPIDTSSSKPPLAGPPSSRKRNVQRFDALPELERLESFPEVVRTDTEAQIHSMYKSMVGPTQPVMFRIPPSEDPTLFAEEDTKSVNLAGKPTSEMPSVEWVAGQPQRRREEPARSAPLELINPHLKAPEEPPVRADRTSETLMRLPHPESSSPDSRIDRSLVFPQSTTLTTTSPVDISRNAPVYVPEIKEISEVSEKPTNRSHAVSNVASKNEPLAVGGPASEVLDHSRFASRYDEIPSIATPRASGSTSSPRAPGPQRPSHASSAPQQDPTLPWSRIDLRTTELSGQAAPSNFAQAAGAAKKRARDALQLGFELAQRRSFHASHARFIEALQIVAQSLDELKSSHEHRLALRRGLEAYDEAVDFQARSDQPDLEISLRSVSSRHDTPVLQHVNLDDWNRDQCLREYMSFAEREIVHAVGPEPLAAQALYGLGRLQAHLQSGNPASANVRTHRALMLYQAALIVDERHYSAANELGVLLASHGRLEEAVTALRHCVRLSPQPTAWQNLAVVHGRLGQADLARLASEEARMANSLNPQPMVMTQ